MLGSPLTPSDRRSLQIVSLVKETGELEISLNSAIVPPPRPDEVVLRVDAAPINPSDLTLLLAGADANELASSGTAERPVLTGRVRSTTGLAGRLGQALPVGNEGAGTIVEAGSSAGAQALVTRAPVLSSRQAPPPERRRCWVGWSRRRREEACMPSTACCAPINAWRCTPDRARWTALRRASTR